jgi:hypothetical protein
MSQHSGAFPAIPNDPRTLVAIARLEAGESPATVATSLGFSGPELILVAASSGLGGEGSEGPELTQRSPGRPRLTSAFSDASLALLFPGSKRPARLALLAGLLQILDAWDASHEAAQEADDLGERATAAYWHGIAHRREPDAGNARYWFHRVGKHPLFPRLATLAEPMLESEGNVDGGLDRKVWDPSKLIDVCTRSRPGTSLHILARKLQRLEMRELLEESLRGVER